MTVIAEFTLAAEDFPLGAVLEQRPDASFELDRVVPSEDSAMPYFWVSTAEGNMPEILDLFEGIAELRSVTLMEDLGERGLFRAEWRPEHLGIMAAINETDVTVVSAIGSKEGWTFQLRGDTSGAISAFNEYCKDHGITASLDRLSQLSDFAGNEQGLTPEQREALLLAYEEGYYDEPKGTSLEALADRLGISRRAVSSRLTRGYRTLIEGTLLHGTDGDVSPTDERDASRTAEDDESQTGSEAEPPIPGDKQF